MKVTLFVARKRAAEYGLLDDLNLSLVHGDSLIEALEEWDLLLPDDEVEDVRLSWWQRVKLRFRSDTPEEKEQLKAIEEMANMKNEDICSCK